MLESLQGAVTRNDLKSHLNLRDVHVTDPSVGGGSGFVREGGKCPGTCAQTARCGVTRRRRGRQRRACKICDEANFVGVASRLVSPARRRLCTACPSASGDRRTVDGSAGRPDPMPPPALGAELSSVGGRRSAAATLWELLAMNNFIGRVSVAGNRQPIPKHTLPACSRYEWLACGTPLSCRRRRRSQICYQDGVDV